MSIALLIDYDLIIEGKNKLYLFDIVTINWKFQDTAQDILEFANSLLEKREAIAGGLKIVDKIPRNPTGKIMRYMMVGHKDWSDQNLRMRTCYSFLKC